MDVDYWRSKWRGKNDVGAGRPRRLRANECVRQYRRDRQDTYRSELGQRYDGRAGQHRRSGSAYRFTDQLCCRDDTLVTALPACHRSPPATSSMVRGRMAKRVASGGHGVPEVDVRRRFGRSVALLRDHASLCDRVVVFDNTGPAPNLLVDGWRGDESLRAMIFPWEQEHRCDD